MPTFVIVGASLAGAKAAETLREEGFDGEIVLLGTELELPYERPPLSKGYLLGKDERASIYVHPEEWYAGHGVDLRLGVTVTAIDRGRPSRHDAGPAARRSCPTTSCCSRPARPRAGLTFPGSDLDEVLYLRTAADSDRLRAAFQPGPRVVVAGAGWIGLETAAAARPRAARSPCSSRSPARCTTSSAPSSAPSSPTCTARTAWSSASASGRPSSAPAWSSPPPGPKPRRPARRRHRRGPERRAGRRGRAGDRQRRADRRGPAHRRREHLRRR